MAWHSIRWRSAGAALAFLLAAVAVVVGSQLTGDLTVALVVFVALLAAGMAVTFVLERHTDGHLSSGDHDVGGGEPGRVCDLRGVRGMQVGDGNRQLNYFVSEPDRRE